MTSAYSGVCTAISNVSSVTAVNSWRYTKTNQQVEVWARATIIPTNASASTKFRVSLLSTLPVSSSTPNVFGSWNANPPSGTMWRMAGNVQYEAGQSLNLLCTSNDGPTWANNGGGSAGDVQIHFRYTTTALSAFVPPEEEEKHEKGAGELKKEGDEKKEEEKEKEEGKREDEKKPAPTASAGNCAIQ